MGYIHILRAPAAGEVVSLGVLNMGEHRLNSARRGTLGFAVRASGIWRTYYRLLPALEIFPPADGAVTAVGAGSFRLRQGNGLELEITLPGEAEYFIRLGELARVGEPVCRIDPGAFAQDSAGVTVSFCNGARVTELHVFAGAARRGSVAAEYSVREPE